MLLPATPGWVSLPVVVCGSPPLLAGACWRWWCVVCGVWCVVCGVRRWCVGGVVAGVWCGWSLATPGGGSCVLLPATPGWVSLPVVVGGPRHSWLGSAGGGGVWCVAVVCWWGCGWCVVWLVPSHSWQRFLCATPRHSWLGFAAGGGGRSSPLLAEGPGRGSPPLLAGVRWRRCVAWSVPRHSWRRFLRATPRHSWLGFGASGGVWSPASPGWGPLAAVVCGVWCVVCGVWCVVCGVRRWCAGGVAAGVWCGWFLATPGGGSCVLLPATPGWVLLPAVVGVPRHSWRRVPGAVLATPGWVSLSAVVCGVWCVVCGVWRAAVACVVSLWLVCGVVGPSPLLAEVPVCYSPPLLAGFRCRWWWCVSRAGVSFVVCVCGVCGCARWPCCVVCCVFVVSVFLVVWCGGAVGVSSGCPSPWPWCVCVRCVALRVGVGGVGGGGVVRGVAVVRARACARGVWLVGWGVSYLGWFSLSVVGMFQKAEEEVL